MENTNTNISHNGEDLLVVKDLCKTFKNGKKTVYALDHVSNVIKKNEKVVIIGPSGSGKSTFLRCLNCMEDPTGGSIFFEGEDLADMKVDINKHREHIGMVFQQFNLFNNKTVLQNIMLAPVYIRTKKAGGLFAPRSVKKQIKAEAEAKAAAEARAEEEARAAAQAAEAKAAAATASGAQAPEAGKAAPGTETAATAQTQAAAPAESVPNPSPETQNSPAQPADNEPDTRKKQPAS